MKFLNTEEKKQRRLVHVPMGAWVLLLLALCCLPR